MSRMKTDRSESTTVTVRVHPDLKEQYESALGDQNTSDDIRDHMKEVADVSEAKDDGLPAEEDLRKAFVALEKISDTRDKVETEMAKTTVSNKLNLPKGAVKGALFDPLRETGHLEPRWGKVRISRVYEPDINAETVTGSPEVPADD